MRGVNKAILLGTLGRDPETKTFPNGGSITQFSIATTEVWNDKNTNERVENTEWHRITASNKLGEIAQNYLRKGSKVYIEGKIKTRKWTDQNGVEKYTTEIQASSLQLIDSKGDSPQQSNSQPQQVGYGSQTQGGYGQQNNRNDLDDGDLLPF